MEQMRNVNYIGELTDGCLQLKFGVGLALQKVID